MTGKTFYEQPELDHCKSTIVSSVLADDGFYEIALDASIFYPEGGGQPCDLGSLGGFQLESVVERGDTVIHRLKIPADGDATTLAEGAIVDCVLDLARRRDHSQQHSAQHLLSAILAKKINATTLSFHLGQAYSSIDLDIAAPDRKLLDAVEDEILDTIKKGQPVITHVCSQEEAEKYPLRKDISVDSTELRIVEIAGSDYSACCGTHVKDIRELVLFRILRAEKYKAGCRLFFVAGRRAILDWRRLAAIARDAALAAAVSEDNVVGVINSLKEKQKGLEKSLSAMTEAWAGSKAELLASGSEKLVVKGSAESSDAALGLAKALAALGRDCAIMVSPETKAILASPAPKGAEKSLTETSLGPLAKSMGARGGGKHLFQAMFPDKKSLEDFMDRLD